MTPLRLIGVAFAVVGTLADWYTTKRGLAAGLREANPVSRWIMEKTGKVWVATLLVDAVVLVGFAAALDLSGNATLASWFLIIVGGIAQLAAARRNRLLTLRKRR